MWLWNKKAREFRKYIYHLMVDAYLNGSSGKVANKADMKTIESFFESVRKHHMNSWIHITDPKVVDTRVDTTCLFRSESAHYSVTRITHRKDPNGKVFTEAPYVLNIYLYNMSVTRINQKVLDHQLYNIYLALSVNGFFKSYPRIDFIKIDWDVKY